jgi:hypothetical protein
MIVQVLVTAGYAEYPLRDHTPRSMTDAAWPPAVMLRENPGHSLRETEPPVHLAEKQHSTVTAHIAAIEIEAYFSPA